MRIIDKRKSLETCTESGWDAVDFLLDAPMDDAFIEGIRRIEGSFLYMRTLKNPFFKLEYHTYVLKGVKGNDFLRMSYHKDSVDKVEEFINILGETY